MTVLLSVGNRPIADLPEELDQSLDRGLGLRKVFRVGIVFQLQFVFSWYLCCHIYSEEPDTVKNIGLLMFLTPKQPNSPEEYSKIQI